MSPLEPPRPLPGAQSERAVEDLVHDLQVHQIELEMQNEALRQAKIELEESRDRYVDLYEFAPVGYITLACGDIIDEINLTGARLLGRERAGVLHRSFSAFLVDEDLPRWARHLARLAGNGWRDQMELTLRRGDGSTFGALVDCAPIVGETPQTQSQAEAGTRDGALSAGADLPTIGGIRLALSDITARKAAEARSSEAERSLRESQRLVALAQEAGHVGFFRYQFEDDVFSWTAGLARLFGFTASDGASSLAEWVARLDPYDWRRSLRVLRRALLRRQERAVIDCRLFRPDGTVCCLDSRLQISYVDDGWPQQLNGIAIDVTEQRLAERERLALIERERAAREEAEAASRAKDAFLAMLGHELRNPLAAISAALEMLERVGGGDEIALKARLILERQAQQLTRMVDDLIDLARVVSGRVHLRRERLDLAARTRSVMDAFEIRIAGQPVRHEWRLALHEVWVDADAARLEQIINNLLGNALKYTPPGGCIEVCVRPEAGAAILEMNNTGPGIPPDVLPRIFDLFVQDDRSLDRSQGGLGIGLSVVRRLVELHGGQINAESDSRLTRMRVRLPAVEAPARRAHAIAAAASAPARSRPRRIVLVDDNHDMVETLSMLLKIDGHTVSVAGDGVSGLALLLEVMPDVAIVDIGLPGFSGFELAQRAREAGYNGRLAALTGYAHDYEKLAGKAQRDAARFDVLVLKPLDEHKLRAILGEE